jgi:acetyl esterase/lipase
MIPTRRVTPAWKRRLSIMAYGLVTRLYGPDTQPATARRRFARLATVSRESIRAKYPNVVFSDHQAGRTPIEGLCAVSSPARVVLYLHGGGYIFGSPATYRDRVRAVSYRCRAEVFVPDYRLAPEDPFPAALEDALEAWAYVAALRPDVPLVIAGDSAGGGLTLAVIAALRDRGQVLPDAAVAISPWADLAITGESVATNHGKDVWMTRRHLESWRRHYVGNADPSHPGISPVNADFAGFPPLFMVVGDHEAILDDTLRVESRARSAGVDVDTCVGRGMQHGFPLTLPWLEESREAWEAVVAFLDRTATAATGRTA